LDLQCLTQTEITHPSLHYASEIKFEVIFVSEPLIISLWNKLQLVEL